MTMDYRETLDFLFSQLPMFQRTGGAAYKVDLTNTIALCKRIGNPEKELRFVHVAGTNGKGSTSHMIASVLQEAGFKTGLYTSPHLKDFRERIRIDGEMITEDAVVSFVHRYKEDWEQIEPSFFEITVAMAFWYFKEENVDIVVLETGMGGRLDSTNVVRPEVSVITSIGLDHQQFLGDTIAKIAAEKAGIIKPLLPVVAGHLEPEAMQVVQATASERKSPFYAAEDLEGNLPPTSLKGPFQPLNVKTAITALMVLRQKGYAIEDHQIKEGLLRVTENTGLLGRWQVLSDRPLTITDCGHNKQALSGIIKAIQKETYENLHMVVGFSNDKSIDHLLELLPKEATYYFAAANIPRALPADDLKEIASRFGLRGEKFSSVSKAYEAARLYASKEDLIYIGGSVFVVAEVV